ncbi:39S ribosomal protein L3, mitochondrial [Galendromus occidentalis]|uniref:Large ribosomal subunit protein uL3m n=1 Tax=Galendromus occidentalis TaxID=34638 RepID=A0AAJ7P9U9_9ACAR|nr:39S ribosomal protein L3, mitochondrial [Galendromus occidentalis]
MSGLLTRLFSSQLQISCSRLAPLAGTQCVQHLQIREKSTKPKRRKVHPFHWWAPKNRADMSEDLLTEKNQVFLQQVAERIYLAPGESPLNEEPWPIGTYQEGSRRTGIIAKKIGVVPMWLKSGKRVLASMLHVCEQNVITYMDPETYARTRFGFRGKGHGCLIVGAESRDPTRFRQEYLDLFKESGVAPKKKLTKFLVTPNAALQPGTPLFAGHFKVGNYVNIYGKTIDRGFLGAKRRWGMKGGRATHGTTKNHNRMGAMGGPRGRILKGKKMGGHDGQERRLLVGVKILRINYKHGVIYVRGPSVMGEIGAFVQIYDALIPEKRPKEDNMPPFPTYFPAETDPLPEDVFDETVHPFDAPSIEFEQEVQVKRKLKVKARAKAAGKR